MRYAPRRGIALHGSYVLAGEEGPKVGFRVTRKKLAQVFSPFSLEHIGAQKAFNGCGHFFGAATKANGTPKAGMFTHGAAQAEVVSILHASIHLDLFAFQANIGNAVLTATVRASRDIQLELLIEAGKTIFQFFHEPAGK